jgi:hypothetical protein
VEVPVNDLRRWETILVSAPLPANEEDAGDDNDAAKVALGFPPTGTAKAAAMLPLEPAEDMEEMPTADPETVAEGAAPGTADSPNKSGELGGC